MKDSLSNIRLSPRASMRQQLSRQLREMIMSGEMNEGDRLPSNQELAERWKVAASSVQAAMASLVKEGLLHRARKRGTFVAKRSRAVTHVAIYLGEDIWHMRAAAFRRAVVTALSDQLVKRKIQPVIWSDSRPPAERKAAWPDLIRAAEQRQIQAVMMCSGIASNLDWLLRLPVPLVALTSSRSRNCVGSDDAYAERQAVQELARQGCRSIGMISPVKATAEGSSATVFRDAAREFGLEIRDEWIRIPTGKKPEEDEAEHFGYGEMKALLALPDRPDGAFVTYDWVARGALMAVLESRIAVPQKLKLVLHRNVELGLLCPVEASFVDCRIGDVAEQMILMMEAQLRGEECESVRVKSTISHTA